MIKLFWVILKFDRYALYVLFLLTVVFLLNQIDRFVLATISEPLARDIKFGDKACLPLNSTFAHDYKQFCINGLEDSKEPESNRQTT